MTVCQSIIGSALVGLEAEGSPVELAGDSALFELTVEPVEEVEACDGAGDESREDAGDTSREVALVEGWGKARSERLTSPLLSSLNISSTACITCVLCTEGAREELRISISGLLGREGGLSGLSGGAGGGGIFAYY